MEGRDRQTEAQRDRQEGERHTLTEDVKQVISKKALIFQVNTEIPSLIKNKMPSFSYLKKKEVCL